MKTADLPEDLWYHTTRVLGLVGDSPTFPLALAALLHEIGAPFAQNSALSPAEVAARKAEEIADRLRLSNAEKERAAWLIENQKALVNARTQRISRLKQLFVHPGIRELLALHRAEALASGNATDDVDYCERLLATWTHADLNPEPLLTGDDLKRHGLKPGPIFKELLDAVRVEQLDGTVTTRQQALEFAERLMREK